jgi:hypothetical protein
MITEIHEKNAAVVTETVHPAGEADCFARVGRAELVACMGTVRMHGFFIPDNKKIGGYYIINHDRNRTTFEVSG